MKNEIEIKRPKAAAKLPVTDYGDKLLPPPQVYSVSLLNLSCISAFYYTCQTSDSLFLYNVVGWSLAERRLVYFYL